MAYIFEAIVSVIVDVLIVGTGTLILRLFGVKDVSEIVTLLLGLVFWLLFGAVVVLTLLRS